MYATHDNTAVLQQLRCGLIPTPLPLLLGCFHEVDAGHLFEYAERRWPDDSVHPELPHVIYVGPAGYVETRLAKVLQTVAYVLTENDGIQKWSIKQHRHYDTSWVRA